MTEKPLTLDDVAARINTICDNHLEAMKNAKQALETQMDALAAAVDASPALDQDTVGAIIFGRVNKLMKDVAGLED